ncbi:MAG TPA: FKBP-type peptidyl-prolyl cis-trans isomerase [Actinomycetes bacterium]|nr:FKBP-type peptidyl-prolyl cis-trans isomerase [Actinomycetes bacterium]
MRLSSSLRRPLIVAVLPAALLLAACGGSSSTGSSGSGSSASSSTATSTGASAGASTATSASPTPTFAVGPGPTPTVTGAFDTNPTITLPADTPSKNLVVKTLIQGNGPTVKAGDLLVADYVGEVWKASTKAFDSSFARGVPAAFPIGTGQVIPGWDKGLVGVKVGSRVVLVIPPAAGYGSAGQSSAGITGTDTLVFVVDVLGHYDGSGRAHGTATNASLAGLPTVTGAVDAAPKVTVPAETAPPTKARAIVLVKGDGPPVKKKSLVIAQYVAVGWDNTAVADTWSANLPGGLSVGMGGTTTNFDPLIGLPVGSRVLLLLPAPSGQDPTTTSIAAVIDIVANVQSKSA